MATILYPMVYGHGKHNDLDFTMARLRSDLDVTGC